MATVAQDKTQDKKAAKQPISLHPAFPFIVALWFAALLGLGSLVVPVEVIEQVVVSSGLSTIVPPTAPPLGFTARALIALSFTLAGAAAGLFVARQVAKAHKGHMGASRRRPIAAHDELGDGGFDGVAKKGRRSLAIADEGNRSEYLPTVPLPGAQEIDVEGLELADTDMVPEVAAEDDAYEAFELADEQVEEFSIDQGVAEEDLAPAGFDEAPAPRDFAQPADIDTNPGFDSLMADEEIREERQEFIPVPQDQPLEEEPAEEVDAAHEPEAEAEDVLQFSPPSMAHAQAEDDTDTFQDDESIADEQPQDFSAPDAFAEPAHTTDPIEDTPDMIDEPAAFEPDSKTALADTPLEELGLVQLAERLGSSIVKRRAMRDAKAQLAASAAPAPRPLPTGLDMAEADEAAQAMAAWFGKPAAQAEQPEEQAPAPEAEAVEADEPAPFADFAEEPAGGDFAAEAGIADEPEAPAPMDFSRPDLEARQKDAPADRQVFKPLQESAPEAPAPYQATSEFDHLNLQVEDEEEDSDEIADLAASFSLPLDRLHNSNRPAPAFAAPAEDSEPVEHNVDDMHAEPEVEGEVADSEDEDEGDFGSLLGMGNPFRKGGEEFVRIEDEPEASDSEVEPAVIFPNATRAFDRPADAPAPAAKPEPQMDGEENERALREALLNLQRMRGAG